MEKQRKDKKSRKAGKQKSKQLLKEKTDSKYLAATQLPISNVDAGCLAKRTFRKRSARVPSCCHNISVLIRGTVVAKALHIQSRLDGAGRHVARQNRFYEGLKVMQ